MREVWKTVQDMYLAYQGENEVHLILFWGCCILLFLKSSKEENKIGHAFGKYVFLFVILAGCPLTANIIMKYCVGKEVYWRMLWLLPVSIILAYVGAKTIEKIDKKWKKGVALIAVIGLVMVGGTNLFQESNFQKSQNHMQLPNTVVSVCNYLEADAKENDLTEIRAIMSPGLMCYTRQYDGKIKQAFGRDAARGAKNRIYKILNTDPINCKKLAKAAKRKKCNYLVYAADERLDAELKKNQFQYLTSIEEYKIYRFDADDQ
ncbi:MAG: hypothetical protein ACI4HI_02475 [Lachnospiraceae bacterium]